MSNLGLPQCPVAVCDIYRYWSLSVIKVERQNNQKWYQYHKYRYFSLLCNGRGNFLYLHMWSKNEPSQNLGPRSRRHMPNKRTADAAPDGAGAPKVGRGGGGRGAGRKRKAENRPGVDAAEAPKRKQQDLGDLFGEPFKKKNTLGDLLGARKDAGAGEGLIKWDYVQHDGGDKDRSIPQRQKPQGRVQYDMEKEALARLIRKGPEVYYINEDNALEEVEETHPKAKRAERNGPRATVIPPAAAAPSPAVPPRGDSDGSDDSDS